MWKSLYFADMLTQLIPLKFTNILQVNVLTCLRLPPCKRWDIWGEKGLAALQKCLMVGS